MKKRLLLALTTALLLSAVSAPADLLSDLDSIVRPQIAHGDLTGVIIGTSDHGQRGYLSWGTRSQGQAAALDQNSLFEIGSITKTFTAIALGRLSLRGTVGLDDSLAKTFPELLSTSAAQITLRSLATHTSGLPRLPDNLDGPSPACAGPASFDPQNPYAQYVLDNLICYLAHAIIAPEPAQFSLEQYSNVGVATLGDALTRADALDTYEQMIDREVLTELGLTDTSVTLTADQQARFVAGYTESQEAAKPWTQQAMAGAGALRSSARDLLAYAEANIHPPDSELGRAITLSHQLQKSSPERWGIGLDWLLQQDASDPLVWHDGATGGYSSFVVFQAAAQQAYVYLSDSPIGPQCVAEYFLKIPCTVDFGQPLSGAEFAAVTGNYRTTDGSFEVSTRPLLQANDLIASIQGVDYRLKALSPTSFDFYSLPDTHIEFVPAADGSEQTLKFTQGHDEAVLTRVAGQGGAALK